MEAWHDRLYAAWKRTGWSKVELGRRSGIAGESIYKYLKGEVKQPRGDTFHRLADALGVHYTWLRNGVGAEFGRVPVVGYLGADQAYHHFGDLDQGAGRRDVDFSIEGADPVAVEVRTASMRPVYRPGDYLVCSRVDATDEGKFLGRECVVKLKSSEGYVKKVIRGRQPGRYTLVAYGVEEIPDVELEWAAPIVWIKRAQ